MLKILLIVTILITLKQFTFVEHYINIIILLLYIFTISKYRHKGCRGTLHELT